MDRSVLQAEAMKYLPKSERYQNMQCFKSQIHMCLTIGLEDLTPPSPEERLQIIKVSSTNTDMLLLSTKSGVRNAISLSHPDYITKEDITSHFVSQKKWKEVNNESTNTDIDATTTVDVNSFFVRLCGVSVAACFCFKRQNIVDDKCFCLHDDKYTQLGMVSRLKPMPMPSRANDVGPLFFQ